MVAWVLVILSKAFTRVLIMNSNIFNIFGTIGPGFLNQVPTLGDLI